MRDRPLACIWRRAHRALACIWSRGCRGREAAGARAGACSRSKTVVRWCLGGGRKARMGTRTAAEIRTRMVRRPSRTVHSSTGIRTVKVACRSLDKNATAWANKGREVIMRGTRVLRSLCGDRGRLTCCAPLDLCVSPRRPWSSVVAPELPWHCPIPARLLPGRRPVSCHV